MTQQSNNIPGQQFLELLVELESEDLEGHVIEMAERPKNDGNPVFTPAEEETKTTVNAGEIMNASTPDAEPPAQELKHVLIQVMLRNVVVNLANREFWVDLYWGMTWRENTTSVELLDASRSGGRSVDLKEIGSDDLVSWKAFSDTIPEGEYMNAADLPSDFIQSVKPSAALVFSMESPYMRDDCYPNCEKSSSNESNLVAMRAVWHVKGNFKLEDTAKGLVEFPFDIHVLNIVFECWSERSDVKFVVNADAPLSSLLDTSSPNPLFPLPQWNLISAQPQGEGAVPAVGTNGIALWTFTRHYSSDLFTSSFSSAVTEAHFSNVVFSIILSRNPWPIIMDIVPILKFLAFIIALSWSIPVVIDDDGAVSGLFERIELSLASILTAVFT